MSGMLHIEGLSAGYRDRPVFADLSLAALRAGQVTALVGPNGAGKSTLLRAIAGLIASTGAVRLDDVILNGLSIGERARHVAYMPQTLPQDVALSVLETVIAAFEASGPRTAGAGPQAAMQALAAVGAVDLAHRRLDRLSGGQRQIAGLAQAIVRQPQVLLLDEPTSALDLRHQHQVLTLAGDYARRHRAVVVMVLHDLQAAARTADHMVVFSGGRVHVEGPPAQAITPRSLADVWQVRARVEPCGRGLVQVMVDDVL